MNSIPYPKIETLFARDESFKVKVGEFKRPVYSQIGKWLVTEKVDGTNIRLHFYKSWIGPGGGEVADWPEDNMAVNYEIGGRTNNAQLPKPLEFVLRELSERIRPEVQAILTEHELNSLTLYGEGYGPKIQPVGSQLAHEPKFILFDVRADDTFLSEQAVTDTAKRLNIDRVPILGYWTIDEALDWVRLGFDSQVAKRNTSNLIDAEGIVGKTLEPLYDSRGHRLVIKLKTKDFA